MGFCQIDSRVALVRSHSFEWKKKKGEKERKKWLSLSRYGSSTWRTIDLPETKSFSLRGHGWTPRAVCSLPTFLRLFAPKACNLTSDCSPSSSLISWLIESFWSLKPLPTACLLAGAFVRAACVRVYVYFARSFVKIRAEAPVISSRHGVVCWTLESFYEEQWERERECMSVSKMFICAHWASTFC